MTLAEEKIREMAKKAEEVYRQAYAPYSRYPVGAAALFASGKIYTGCNVENASFGLTLCAERNAIFQGVSRGERQLAGIAIAVPAAAFPVPCGACRQVIREFTADCPVILVNGTGQWKIKRSSELLPDAFGPESLEKITGE